MSSDPREADLVGVGTDREWGLWIGGEPRPALSGASYTTISPATEEPIGSVPDGGPDDVDAAVSAAAAPARAWARSEATARGTALRELARILRANADELAALDAVDSGNPVTAMRMDVEWGAVVLELFADGVHDLGATSVPASADNVHFVQREPWGVVARIIPFNHPLLFAASKIAAPLAAGNAVVLKPPEVAPLSALRMAELSRDVLPPGLLSVVVGDGPAVPDALVRHPEIRRIGFIGSETTGRAIQRSAAESGVKDVSLELGGKNALIVFPDADLDKAATGIVNGMNFAVSAGQSCGSTSRVLVHESIADQVVERVTALAGAIPIGHPLDPEIRMGPVASRAQFEKTRSFIEAATSEGATLVSGGGRPELAWDGGFFVAPTVFTGVTPGSTLEQEEVFGPVLSVLTWRTEQEAVAIANGTRYGLTASVWTEDLRTALRMVRQLDAGYVWVNGSSRHFWGMPFGGFKSSGIGREESREELLSYTQVKSVNIMMA